MNANDRSQVLARSKVPEPVREVLLTRANPLQQAQSWAQITARLEVLPRQRATTRRAFGWLACSLVVVGLGFGFDVWLRPAHHTSSTAVPTNAAGFASAPVDTKLTVADLRLRGGAEFKRLSVETPSTAADNPTTATFEDGSTIEVLAANTLVEALAMTERDVMLRLVSGSIKVSVVKGGARRWLLEAGELSVEVVGTQFVVARNADKARVAVHEGVVLVRSAELPDGVKRLVAGESQEIQTRGSMPTAPTPTNEAASHEARNEPSKTALTPTFDNLLQQADDAREAGDLKTASTRLQHLLQAFPNDAQSGVVAFQLALVVQQMGASPSQVVTAFESALAKARGQSLRQDCYWRLVLALEHAGRYDEAKQRAEDSLRVHPNGRYAAELRQRTSKQPAPIPSP